MSIQCGQREVAVDRRHLEKVINMFWDDEQRHYEEADTKDQKKGHIFLSLQHLRRQIKRQMSGTSVHK